MKKISILVCSIIISLGLSSVAYASGDVTMRDKACITPDSSLYFIQKVYDTLRIKFTGDEISKAQILSIISEEKLGESEIMVDKNKPELAEKSLQDYNNYINQSIEIVENAQESKDKLTDDNTEKLNKLENGLQNTEMNSIEVLKKIEAKLPDKAKAVIEDVIKMQTAKKEAIIALRKERVTLNNIRKQYNQSKQQLKIAQQSKDSTAIAKAQEDLNAKENALTLEKAKFVELFKNKQEVIKTASKSSQNGDAAIKDQYKNAETTKPTTNTIIKANKLAVKANIETIKLATKVTIKSTKTAVKITIKATKQYSRTNVEVKKVEAKTNNAKNNK